MTETMTCPRQAEATLSVQRAHRPYWRTDTWSRRRIWADWLRDRKSNLMDKLEQRGLPVPRHRDRFSGGTCWPDETLPALAWRKPRTCSYCGSVHPEDAIALLLAGWEVGATGKSYKRYLHPPGYANAVERLIGHQDALSTDRFKWHGPHSPVPPVKLYVMHMTQAQIDQFNSPYAPL
mgnify:FL=1